MPSVLNIQCLVAQFQNRSLTPSQYVLSQLHMLQNVNPKLNAFTRQFDQEYILKQAQESTIRYKNGTALGPFDGIVIAIKDTSSCATKGVQLHKGSMICYLDKDNTFIGAAPTESVKEIAMLQEGGAIILCLTTVPEMCWKGTTSSLLYGVTRNPHNITITTGGSSGGAAALTALGIGNINIGTDGAGSVRIPASCCGVIGYKPSYSIAHSKNKGPSFPYLSHVGPITRHIDDVIVYMRNLSHCTRTLTHLDFSDAYIKHKNGVKGMNIAVSKTLDGIVDYVDDDIWQSVLHVSQYFESKGANVTFVDPDLSSTKMNYFEGVRKLWYLAMKGYAQYVDSVHDGEYKHLVDPGLMEILQRSKTMKDIDELIHVLQARDETKEIMKRFHMKYDLLITPTCALLPPQALSYTEDGYMKNIKTGKMENVWDCYHSNLVFTSLFNFTHQPAISMPCGYVDTENGKIPIGVQIAGAMDKDNVVLRAAYCLNNKFKCLHAKL